MKDYFKYFDKLTFVLLLLLSLTGIILIFSAGHSSQETYYLKQAAWLFLSLLVFFVVFSLKLDFIFRNAFAVYLVLLAILAAQIVLGARWPGPKAGSGSGESVSSFPNSSRSRWPSTWPGSLPGSK